MLRTMWILSLLGLLLMTVGCRNTCDWCSSPRPAGTVYVPPNPTLVSPPPTTMPPPPPGTFPTAPPQGARFVQPGQSPPSPPPSPPPAQSPPPNPPGISSNRIETQLKPADAREPVAAKPDIKLYAPEAIDKEPPAATKEPPLDKKPGVQGLFPSIPQFAVAKDNVYTGLRPPLDGLDWLAQNKIQTVINVHPATADDAADRREAEKRKLQYIPFVVSPQTLTKDKADEFTKLIRENAKTGIFVYDEDGSLAASMWYLHFRWGDFLDDDAAQLRARPLGLRTDVPMWLAVQKLLSENDR